MTLGGGSNAGPETELQRVLRACIESLVQVTAIFDYGPDTQYGLMNYIARYALASDTYLVSRGGAEIVAAYPAPFRRRWLDKGAGTFEHLVPATVIRDRLRDSDRSPESVSDILRRTSAVAVVSKYEDRQLALIGLTRRMPSGWVVDTGDLRARYAEAGIEIIGSIAVIGPLVR